MDVAGTNQTADVNQTFSSDVNQNQCALKMKHLPRMEESFTVVARSGPSVKGMLVVMVGDGAGLDRGSLATRPYLSNRQLWASSGILSGPSRYRGR